MQHCFRLGLYRQGLLHDMSKYSLVEFLPGIKYYQGNRSPNEAERTDKGYSAAWLHHKGRNKHHMEYWIDYPGNGKAMEGVEMPLCYVAEMFCDRVAASKTYLKERYHDGSPWEYYAQRHDHYWLHPNTRNILETMLQTLRDQGEEKAFSYIRKEFLNK